MTLSSFARNASRQVRFCGKKDEPTPAPLPAGHPRPLSCPGNRARRPGRRHAHVEGYAGAAMASKERALPSTKVRLAPGHPAAFTCGRVVLVDPSPKMVWRSLVGGGRPGDRRVERHREVFGGEKAGWHCLQAVGVGGKGKVAKER
jgi:hypothetical protein